MTAPSVAGFKSQFPRFNDAAYDDGITTWMADALVSFTPSVFAARWALVAYLHTAHFLTLYPPAGVADLSDEGTARGPVTSEKVADLSRNYAQTFKVEEVPPGLRGYLSTSYGQQLIAIALSRRAVRGRIVPTGTTIVSTSSSS